MNNFLVIGLGKSGVSVVKLLQKQLKNIYVYDQNKEQIEDLIYCGIVDRSVKVLDKLCAKTLKGIDCIVISPGVKLKDSKLSLIKKLNIQLIGELMYSAQFCKGQIFAITGTNGKTTTSNFLYQIFKKSNISTYLLGNVGTPLSEEVQKIQENDKIVLEVSSFQLENTLTQKFTAGAILNLASDHLDRYKSFENYVEAKKNMLKCIKNNNLVLNYDDLLVRNVGTNEHWYFSLNKLPANLQGVFFQGQNIIFQEKSKVKQLISIENCRILGKHNIQNLMCAIVLAYLGGVDIPQIQQSINSLNVPRHRLEYVDMVNGVEYYNDSKATNCHSTRTAVESIDKPIWLLLGGSDKKENFDSLMNQLPNKVIEIVCFGQNGKIIYKTCKKYKKNCVLLQKLSNAFDFVKQKAKPGEVVLLSPACASFDEFLNFEERGKYFCSLVSEWKNEEKVIL